MHQKSQRQHLAAEFSDYKAKAAQEAASASEAYRSLEQAMAERSRQAESKAKERQAQHEKALASVRVAADADRRLLVNRIAELSSCGAPEGSASAAGDGAGAIGELLEEGLQLQAELAAAAESNADAYRAMREAWPD
jgi:hypothetical protein